MQPNEISMTIETIDRQRRYVQAQKQKGHGLGVVFADAFLRGMRDLGYKNPAWALAEMIDNAVQAAADTVTIRFGFEDANRTRTKPDRLAICDNGNGMIPEMISYAVRWGGTDREGDRKGFGRYGYGLPSSAVSLAKRYVVYSRADGGDWHAVIVDIDQLAAAAGDIQRTEALLAPQKRELPSWLGDAANADDSINLTDQSSGTVVVLEDLDRLRRLGGWIKVESLRTKLLQHFGVIYRHWVPERRIVVDGASVQAVDPLFLMEHARFYDESPVRAERVEARTFDVETSRGTTGRVSIRASVLPPNFQLADASHYRVKGAKLNKRWDVMRDYNGLLICREHRQIDCILPRWTKFQTYDANIKVEVNFDPELDELFGITTAKQQIVLEDEMWEKLQHSGKSGGGLKELVEDLRHRFEELQSELKAKVANVVANDAVRPSALAMEQSTKLNSSAPEPTPAQQQEAQRNLNELALERAEATGLPMETILTSLIETTSKRRWEVAFAAVAEGPFYRPARLGQQKRLVINTEHPFYRKVYDQAPDIRAALEVLLFVLAERELEVKGDAESFYKAERQHWSERLRHALDTLLPSEPIVNKASAVAERMHNPVEEVAHNQ